MSDFVSIEVLNASERGITAAALLEAAGDPALVVKRTRPARYIVPIWVARKAGLLEDTEGVGVEHDEEVPVTESPETTETTVPAETPQEPSKPTYDDGLPDSDWKRADLEAYATNVLGFADAGSDAYSNRTLLLAAINEEIAKRQAAADSGDAE